jgi:UPF0716 protein FxsA
LFNIRAFIDDGRLEIANSGIISIYMQLLLVLFIIIPIVEMVLLIKVGGMIGAIPTVGLVMLTAVIGVTLLRQQGFDTLARLQTRLANGEIPGTELLEGAMLLIGGALLLTPGFLTDAIGFTCLIPSFRRPIAQALIRQGLLSGAGFSRRQARFHTYHQFDSDEPGTDQRPNHGSRTIDGEYKSED